jgi:hypothetical protein
LIQNGRKFLNLDLLVKFCRYKILFLINEELSSAKNISKKARNKICHKKPSIHIPILHIHSRPEKLGELVISSETWLINRVPYLQSTTTTIKPSRKCGHFSYRFKNQHHTIFLFHNPSEETAKKYIFLLLIQYTTTIHNTKKGGVLH